MSSWTLFFLSIFEKNLYFAKTFALQEAERRDLPASLCQFWFVYFSLTSVSWNLGSELALVRRTGALGLWYGVVLWGFRHHGVRIGDCRGKRVSE